MKCQLGILVVAAILSAAPSAVAADEAGGPIFTNKARFRIPFRYDRAEMQRLGAREVQLFVAADHGSWRLAGRAAPSSGRFDFEAPGDGRYLFAVRTLDGRGLLHPADEAVSPGLEVIVDTQPPALEIDLAPVSPGRVALRWRCQDANLNLESLRLEYIQTGDANWQPVQVVPESSGGTSWSAPDGGWVAVRGVVRDRAGNVGRSQKQVQIAAPPPAPRVPDPSAPVAGSPPIPPDARRATGQLVSEVPEERPPILGGGPRSNAPPITDDNGSAVRYVNSRDFQVGYAVDEVGPSGVAAVDLFITDNGGQKWYHYGPDRDRRSPLEIEVPRDGVYGFAIRVRSGAGLAVAPPRPGDRPESVVIVDTAAPIVEMKPIRQSRVDGGQQIEMAWNVRDAYPAEKAVTLAWAEDPAGPWTEFAQGQPGSGHYTWSVEPGLPHRLHLRLTARDAAGNERSVQTREAILVDLTRPRARIVNIEPAGGGN